MTILWLHGCTLLVVPADVLPQYQAALESGDLRLASQLLRRLPQDSAQTGVQKQLLSELIAARKTQTFAEIEQLQAAGEWAQALRLLDKLQGSLPAEENLLPQRQQLKNSRDAWIDSLRLQLTHDRAQYLSRQIGLLQAISEADPSGLLTDWQLRYARQSGYKLVEELLSCAESNIRAGDLSQADYCLQVIAPLADNDQLRKMAAAERLLAGKKRKLQARAQWTRQQQQQRAEATLQLNLLQQQSDLEAEKAALKAEYQDAIAAGWWLSARDKLDDLQRHFPADTDAKRWRRQLQAFTAKYLQKQMRRGQNLYSRGEIAGALEVWRELLPLAPAHAQLLANIARAEKFLAKLEQLEK